ncbi:MAG TPA: helix-turn-helix transcriptional regulator [Cyclobacteriaceae bacterium]
MNSSTISPGIHVAQLRGLPNSHVSLEYPEQLFSRKKETLINHHARTFEFLWVRKGHGWIAIDERNYALEEDTIYFITPGQSCLLNADEGLSGCCLKVSPELLHLLHDQGELSFLSAFAPGHRIEPLRLKDNCTVVEMLDLIALLQKELLTDYLLKEESLKAFLKIFMIYVGREFKATVREVDKEKGEVIVNRFLQLLKDRISSMKQVADYAAELKVTPNYLNIVIKKATGYNASQHIQQFIIMEAKRQATCSGMRMKEIADYLGFADHAHFSKFFKNYSGINFTHFRKAISRSAY